ncbi:tyrosine-protein phosphatase non-receptor type substrate 1-like [Heteronotia binoei]|uniref:tyrosine-protein phosphatase non-receptor type substrate 1-like n=1 Tax=Heteronotia binoei TaxID=13085 RepID=UPI002931CA5A|nr:tyrosine-protein phosphatase non-receptor type substrate 1-like [Heteronotia binoei]
MRGSRRTFPCLLLLLQQSAWAVLRVSVPLSPIRALPSSDQRLPCNFSDPLKPINLRNLAVVWKRGTEKIAEYLGRFEAMRQGAEMSVERLQVGDASLLLPQLQDSDSGVYTCVVIFTPDKDEGRFELKLEAEPCIALGSTKLQLASQGAVTCTISGFYPGDISVEWLKNGAVIKGPQTSVHQDSQNGLYNASSILELTPDIADANANFSCQVRHRSLEGPLKENFQLQLQALPSLQVFTGVSQNTLEVLECLVSGFYPHDVQVHWLQNGVPQQQVESREPQTLPNGTFRMRSMIRPEEVDPGVSYVCQVQHNAWDKPLEMRAHWQPKDEVEGVSCPTPQHPPSSGTEGTPHSCSPTPVPTSPTSATGTVVWPWIVFTLGSMLFVAGGIMLYMAFKKGKNKSYPDTKRNSHLDPESVQCMTKPENDYIPDYTGTSM